MSETQVKKVVAYLMQLLTKNKHFTGKVEFNFKDGIVKDALDSKRTKFNKEGE